MILYPFPHFFSFIMNDVLIISVYTFHVRSMKYFEINNANYWKIKCNDYFAYNFGMVIDTITFQNSRERESSILFNVVKITLHKEFMSDNCGQNNYYHFQ